MRISEKLIKYNIEGTIYHNDTNLNKSIRYKENKEDSIFQRGIFGAVQYQFGASEIMKKKSCF